MFVQEEAHPDQKISEAKVVKLYYQMPPIDKMDSTLSQLVTCEYVGFRYVALLSNRRHRRHLALSTNSIDRIAGLQGLRMSLVLRAECISDFVPCSQPQNSVSWAQYYQRVSKRFRSRRRNA